MLNLHTAYGIFNATLINEKITYFLDYLVLFGKSRLSMVLKAFIKPNGVSTLRRIGPLKQFASPTYPSIFFILSKYLN